MSPLSYFDVSRLSRLFTSASLTGGDDGIRTHDPLLAGQVLSQLSYTPISWGSSFSLECPPLPLESPFRSHRRVTASISVRFPEIWVSTLSTGHSKLNNKRVIPRICTLLDLSSFVVILLYFTNTKSRKPCLQISCSP